MAEEKTENKSSMRLKAGIIIVMIVMGITAASYFSSLNFTTININTTMTRDQSLVRDIADAYIGAKIDALIKETTIVKSALLAVDESEWPDVMDQQLGGHFDFMAFSVVSREMVLASYGNSPAGSRAMLEPGYMTRAFNGSSSISTTFVDQYTKELVFYIYTPMTKDLVLISTIPGMYFSDLLKNYRLWETGSIFLIDDEGTVIAHYEQDRVRARLNYIKESKTNPNMASAAEFFEEMITTHEGTGFYTLYGEERLSSYRQISNHAVDWVVAVVAPLNESPRANVQQGLIVSALLFIIAGVLIAFFISGVVAKPFVRIEAQNEALEELNMTVNEQKEELEAEHERVKLLLDATPLASSLFNANRETFLCNEECVRLFRVDSKEEYMERFFEDLSPEFQPNGRRSDELIRELIDQIFREGRAKIEWMHQTKYGEPLPTEVTVVTVKYEGRDVLAVFVRDMREYKKMMNQIDERDRLLEEAVEEAQRANQAKSDFLAKMSHEMRTPLNAIIGLSALAMESRDIEENRVNIEKVNSAGAVLFSTVNDILDISKIEAGKYELILGEYELTSLINDVAGQSSMYLDNKPIEFVMKIDDHLPMKLVGDELRVKQIFNNLLSNAFKYTNEGTILFEVSSAIEGDVVWLTGNVSDTGVGIKQEDISSLFEDYAQADAKKNRGIMGTGLGLSIIKKLIELMQGSIVVESEYGKGSAFKVMIPQKFVSDEVIGEETAKALSSFKYTEQKRQNDFRLSRVSLPYARVLVVDDVATNLDVARGLMKPYGMKIDGVTSGKQAIETIGNEDVRYDAIFMDQMMPEMDGVETVRRIRAMDSDYAKNIPIIALTANAIVGSEKMFLENGFNAFIPKPIEVLRLDAVIREWIRDKDKENQYFEDQKNSAAAAQEADVDVDRRTQSDRRSGIDRRALKKGVEGLDIDKGVERFSGDWAAYLEVLQSFLVNTPPLLESAKRVTPENLQDYAIVVHGIKGSSRAINATDFSFIAEKLEYAAKDNDFDFVEKHNGEFLEAAWRLLAGIDALLAEIDSASEKPLKDEPDAELLGKLAIACKNYDMDGVDKAVSELKEYDYKSGGEMVEWIWENAERMNFTEIVEKLSSMADEKGD